MPKKTVLPIIALAAIALVLVVLKTRAPKEITIAPDNQSMGEVMTEAQKFAAAIESGEPYTCQIASADTSMTYQFMGGKMYLTTTQESVTTHALNDTAYLYSWVEGATQGTKIAIPSEAEVQAMADDAPAPSDAPSFASEQDYQSYQDAGYTITCREDSFGAALFVPPTEVEFSDPTAMLKEVTGDGESLDMSKLQEMAKQYEGLAPEGN